MLFGQLSGQDGLRGIETGMATHRQRLYHLGIERVKRSITFICKYAENSKLKRKRRVMVLGRTSIEEISEAINNRVEVGHWGADTDVSRQGKTSLMVLQERKTGITIIEKMPRCAPGEMNKAIRLSGFPQNMRKIITCDNGLENRYHRELQGNLGVSTYFCNPYSLLGQREC